jgi:uncharacterized membrane protein
MPMDNPPPPAVPGAPRWMRVLLGLSLALNLLILGAVAGVALRGGPGPQAVRDLGFGPFAAALSPEDRAALRRAWMASGGGEGRRAARAEMRGLLDLLRADPFDAAAFSAHLARGSERMAGRLHLGMTLIEERILALPPADRLAFADRLERAMRRGPRRREAGGAAD